MRGDRRYFLNAFKKEKTPTFDGEMKKTQDEKAWLIGMDKFFKFHNYLENVKAIKHEHCCTRASTPGAVHSTEFVVEHMVEITSWLVGNDT